MSTDLTDDHSSFDLRVMSFNMHGFNQRLLALISLISNFELGIILLQEHWLTPANLSKFNELSANYFSFGGSAMSSAVESGPLRGRPFGGLMCLVNNSLRDITQTIHCSDRFIILRIANFLIINVYFPCAGTVDRLLICDDLLADIGAWCDQYYPSCDIIFGGDFNTDLDRTDSVTVSINNFLAKYNLTSGDDLFPAAKTSTYVNEACLLYTSDAADE